MDAYENGDIATFYFVITEVDGTPQIKAWSDKKQLAEFYMEFHKCPKYRLKKITKRIEEIVKIIEENCNDEISIGNIYMRDTDRKDGNVKLVSIPITDTEACFVREETETFLSAAVNYGYLNGVVPYLKNKYQEALSDIFLRSLINKVVNGRSDRVSQSIQFDQLMVLFRSFPDEFGK